jgi:hypothetical protein
VEGKMTRLGSALALACVPLGLAIAGCGGDAGPTDPDDIRCDVAFNSRENSFVKLVNTLDRDVSATLPRHSISAHVDRRSCVLMGVVAGVADQMTITECRADGSCSIGGRSRTLSFQLRADETETLIVDTGFFR